MPLYEVLKEIDAVLYPDIAGSGSLNVAVSKSLADIGSSLTASTILAEQFMPFAYVEDSSRFSQVKIAGGQRLFLFDFWSEGVMFGSGSSSQLSDVARAVHTWIADKASIGKMSSLFTFFSPTEHGKAHEAGEIVEFQWQSLLTGWRYQEKDFGVPDRVPTPIVEAAMKRPELRQLYPFTSLISLCFSRTTGYPFTKDCPAIEPQGASLYRVYAPNSLEILGEGTVEEALDIVIKNLPPNCGPAVSGTADDFALQQT